MENRQIDKKSDKKTFQIRIDYIYHQAMKLLHANTGKPIKELTENALKDFYSIGDDGVIYDNRK